jgi:hypothetical protein
VQRDEDKSAKMDVNRQTSKRRDSRRLSMISIGRKMLMLATRLTMTTMTGWTRLSPHPPPPTKIQAPAMVQNPLKTVFSSGGGGGVVKEMITYLG